MVKIIEFLLVGLVILLGFAIFMGTIAIEIAHAIMEKIDENRTR